MDPTAYLDYIVANWQLILIVAATATVAVVVMVLIRALLWRSYLLKRETVWLEITPPASIAKTPEATEQLFSVIHGTRAARRLSDKLLGRSPVSSFEIVSSRRDGIRFLVRVNREQSSFIEKVIASYIPNSQVKEINHRAGQADRVIEFRETGHYVLPLTLTSVIEQHDPLSYLTGAMTKLGDDEEITLQIIAIPVRLREAAILSHRILGNENILQQVGNKKLPIIGALGGAFGKIATSATDLTSEVYMGTTYGYKNYYDSKTRNAQRQAKITNHDRPSRTLSAFELELMETMHRKVTTPLFRVDLRILVKSPNADEHIATFKSALDGYSVPPYQSLKTKLSLPFFYNHRQKIADRRLPSLFRRSSMILASTELASLFHFPPSNISQTDNLVTSLSRTLPAPISLKQNHHLDVTLGENRHHGVITPIGLTEQERERHVFIIGGTGNGKTTLLQYSILQDIQNGKGVAIVDPHGDMAETILRHMPKERIKDVIYFNPDDITKPIGMNLLELPEGLSDDDLLREKDAVTESIISVFRKVFSEEDTGGHRIEYVLRNAVQTALTIKDATIFTIFDLLNDPTYRTSIVAKLKDKNLVNFWKHEIGKAGEMQKVKMAAGITAKIGRFLFSASAKRVLEQPKSTIDFDQILAEGKILICNFSKGLIGEDTSELFGITVLAKLQLASLRRARMKQADRRPFYLYVDEFQNFATQSFVQMLSESRKYRLYLMMAEQSTSQQKDQQMVQIILANVGTVICFRTGNPSDEKLLLPMFAPYIDEGEISNQPPFNFYARFASTKSQEPLSGTTIVLSNDGDEAIADEVKRQSREIYGNDPLVEKPVDKKSQETRNGKKANTAKTAKRTTVGTENPSKGKNPEDDENIR
jgi:hypothetical protein